MQTQYIDAWNTQ